MSSYLGANALLFAVTGGHQTANEKIYVINAEDGEVVTLFERNPVSGLRIKAVESETGDYFSFQPLSAAHDITVSRAAAEVYVGELVSPPTNSIHKFALQKDEGNTTFTSSFSKTTMTIYKTFATASKIVRITIVVALCTLISMSLTLIFYGICRILKSRMENALSSFA